MSESGVAPVPSQQKASLDYFFLFSQICGWLAVVEGVIVIISWYAHWTSFIQILPTLAPMQYNTALCFILCGLGLALSPTRYSRWSPWLGGAAASFTFLTLLEYLSGLDFGIDQFFFKSTITTGVLFPGRMAPLTAVCFVLSGSSLVLSGFRHRSRRALLAAGLLACVVKIISGVALFGFLVNIDAATGWGSYAKMAIHTAITFFLISGGLLSWTRQTARRANRDFVHWLPVTASLTLMAMIALVSTVSFSGVKESEYWKAHTNEVLSVARTLLADIFDLQRGTRGVIYSNQSTAMETRTRGLHGAHDSLHQLILLTEDNPSQQKRLKAMEPEFEDLTAYLDRLLEVHRAQGVNGALQMESTGEGFTKANRLLADLQAFTDAEHRLLTERTAASDIDVRNTERLVVYGSLVAGLLLILAHFLANRELQLRRRAETRVQKIVSLQTAVLNSANYAIISTDIKGVVTTFNSTAEKWLGYSAAQMVGKHSPALWHEAEEVAARAKILSVELNRPIEPGFEVFSANASRGLLDEEEWTFVRRDGTRFPVMLSITALKDEAGAIVGYLGVIDDITERKQAEESLRLSEERFSSAFEYAPIGMALVSLTGQWIKANEALCDLLGYSLKELVSKNFQKLTHPDDLQGDLKKVEQLLAGEMRSYQMEKRYFRKDGQIVWAMLSVSLIRSRENQPLYFIAQIEDITATKEAMARQKELTLQAQAAEKAKSEFLAIMSHEIRTPMNGVIGMTSILADTELTPMQRDCVSTIHTSGESLLAVINDILDFSKIESGKMSLEDRPFNLRQCVEEALDIFAVQIRIKNLEGAYQIAPEIPPYLMGDALRLRQVLINLIGNAIKFTTKGEIIVQVQMRGQDENGCHLLFSVTDSGIGISKDGLSKLFQPFQQADTSTTRKFGGTGLGLAISKHLTEMMGGRIWADSIPGTGSTFYFTACMKPSPVAHPKDQELDPSLLKSHTALIVDDNDTNRRILETKLAQWGMTVTAAASGRQALEILKDSRFDFCLLDFQMPEMDGLMLAREIRKKSPIPLVMLSSSGEILKGEDAALFAFQIPKPVKHSSLLNALLQVLGADNVASKAPEKLFDKELGAKHPLRILMVEDNSVNQKVGLRMLSQFGYTADLAGNGLEALDAVAKKEYDVILMDVQMPEMDGIQATQEIHKRMGENSPMIIALTAEALEGDRERLISLGFSDYLSKPLKTTVLGEMLRSVTPKPQE